MREMEGRVSTTESTENTEEGRGFKELRTTEKPALGGLFSHTHFSMYSGSRTVGLGARRIGGSGSTKVMSG